MDTTGAAVTLPVGGSPGGGTAAPVTSECLDRAVDAVRPGRRLADISSAVQPARRGERVSDRPVFVGHGIGKALHEGRRFPNFVDPEGRGPFEARHGPGHRADGQRRWRTPSARGSMDAVTTTAPCRPISSTTVAITDHGPEILTLLDGGSAGARHHPPREESGSMAKEEAIEVEGTVAAAPHACSGWNWRRGTGPRPHLRQDADALHPDPAGERSPSSCPPTI